MKDFKLLPLFTKTYRITYKDIPVAIAVFHNKGIDYRTIYEQETKTVNNTKDMYEDIKTQHRRGIN
jgi:hypothetical protein